MFYDLHPNWECSDLAEKIRKGEFLNLVTAVEFSGCRECDVNGGLGNARGPWKHINL